MRKITGTIILLLGVAATVYGALGFFVYNGLWPNDSISGRLPSLYIMFGGMAALLVGLSVRNLRVGKARG